MAIVHELSWSTSRARTFATCARRYYFDYYLSWLGWDRNAAPERKQAYLLKKMSRFPIVAGDLVHQAIAEHFVRRKQGADSTFEGARDRALAALRGKYKESRDGLWKARPSKLCHLAEHHYEEPQIDEASGAAGAYGKRFVERIERCLATFFESPALAEARDAEPGTWLACEELSTFELFGTKVYAVPDFAYRTPSGQVRILDWKTGRPRPADRFQLEVYAFYARERWGAAPEEIVAEDVYLALDEVHRVTFDAAALDSIEARIGDSIAPMQAVHFDADRGVGDPAAFPLLAAGSEAAAAECKSCNYRELCDRR